jgi:hypothetical protein
MRQGVRVLSCVAAAFLAAGGLALLMAQGSGTGRMESAPLVAQAAAAPEAVQEQRSRLAASTRILAGPDFGWPEAFPRFDGQPTKLFDLDGDGVLEVLLQGDDRAVWVLDVARRRVVARLETSYPEGWDPAANPGLDYKTGVEAVALPDGPVVVSYNSAAVVTLFRPGEGGFTKLWERRLDGCHAGATNSARPVLADLDRDGSPEILAQTEEVGLFAVTMSGAILWQACIPGGNADPAAADVDGDGWVDAVWVADHGAVTLLDGHSRKVAWSFWAGHPRFNLSSASMPVGPAIADLDGRGPLDIVVGARDSHDPVDWSRDHAALFALSGDGNLLWMRQDPEGAPLTYTRPIVRDVDGDGRADVFWADWNNIGHKPPWDERLAWRRTGPAHVYRYDADGDLVWRATLDTPSNDKDILLLDIDGDGVPEVLADGPGPEGNGVWALDVATGDRKAFVAVGEWRLSRGVVAGDVLGTGTIQWLVAVDRDGQGALAVHDTGRTPALSVQASVQVRLG